MQFEATTLAATVRVLTDTLQQHYGLDAVPMLKASGLSPDTMDKAGARYPVNKMRKFWALAIEATQDPCLGLVTGRHVRPTSLNALGFAWYSSRTLHDAFKRLCRYSNIISTVSVNLEIRDDGDRYVLEVLPEETYIPPPAEAIDAFASIVLTMCRQASTADFRPLEVRLPRPDNGCISEYVAVFGSPVFFDEPRFAQVFDKASLDANLPGNNPELARVNDRITEDYLEALHPDYVASEVRKLLIDLLPSGDAEQGRIAKMLNRSTSTMQRQLRAEGTSYRDVLDGTRQRLASEYLRARKHTLTEVAFLLGFSDQSNFSRAFKRWTGKAPGEYREPPPAKADNIKWGE